MTPISRGDSSNLNRRKSWSVHTLHCRRKAECYLKPAPRKKRHWISDIAREKMFVLPSILSLCSTMNDAWPEILNNIYVKPSSNFLACRLHPAFVCRLVFAIRILEMVCKCLKLYLNCLYIAKHQILINTRWMNNSPEKSLRSQGYIWPCSSDTSTPRSGRVKELHPKNNLLGSLVFEYSSVFINPST